MGAWIYQPKGRQVLIEETNTERVNVQASTFGLLCFNFFQICSAFFRHLTLISHLGTIHSEAFAVVGRKKGKRVSLICKDLCSYVRVLVFFFFLGIFFYCLYLSVFSLLIVFCRLKLLYLCRSLPPEKPLPPAHFSLYIHFSGDDLLPILLWAVVLFLF